MSVSNEWCKANFLLNPISTANWFNFIKMHFAKFWCELFWKKNSLTWQQQLQIEIRFLTIYILKIGIKLRIWLPS